MTNTSPSSGSKASRLESCGSFTLHSYHTLITMQPASLAGPLVGPLDGSLVCASSCDGWANSILQAKADLGRGMRLRPLLPSHTKSASCIRPVPTQRDFMSEQSSPVLEGRSCATMMAYAGGLRSSMKARRRDSTGRFAFAGASSMSTESRSNTLKFRLTRRTLDQHSESAKSLILRPPAFHLFLKAQLRLRLLHLHCQGYRQ